jgi:hypothetical protein
MNRRGFLYGLGATLGTVALNSLLQADEPKSSDARDPSSLDLHPSSDPLSPKAGHHPARAKACIMLFLEGGPSHIDTFDPKPKLADLHMQEFQRDSKFASAMASGKRYYVQSPFQFRQAGQSGLWMNSLFENLAGVADDLCVYRGCVAQSVNHPTACYDMNTGNQFGGDPAIGAWATYGLGTMSRNLPGFVVLPEVYYPQGGSANWSNGFLPAHYQATPLRPQGSAILNLNPPPGVTPEMQRANLDLLGELERGLGQRHPEHDDLAARLHSYELAFRMQAEVPGLIDLKQEDAATLDKYGIGQAETDAVGRKCLLARRLVEKGVRFVQIYIGGWDSHDYIEKAHATRIRAIDRPLAALVGDLKRRGMLDETLVIAAGEFGRSPDNGIRGGKKVGRDHNPNAMNILFAGGGTRAGQAIGATDEIGDRAVEVVHPLKDLHVTILHLLGLDDNKLTYFHGGRFKQLSQTGGAVIREFIA